MARMRAGVRRKPIKRTKPGGGVTKPKKRIVAKSPYPSGKPPKKGSVPPMTWTPVKTWSNKPKKKPTIKTSKPKRPPKRVTRRKVR